MKSVEERKVETKGASMIGGAKRTSGANES